MQFSVIISNDKTHKTRESSIAASCVLATSREAAVAAAGKVTAVYGPAYRATDGTGEYFR